MPRMRHALANKTNKCSGVYPHGPNNAGKCLSTIPRIRRSCTDTKKARDLYQSLVPHFEAFALPIIVKRATQKPTPICMPTQHTFW